MASRSFARILGKENLEIKIRPLKKERPELSDEEAVGHVVRSELGIKPLKVKAVKARKEAESA